MNFITQKFIESSIWCLNHPLHTLIALFVLCVVYYFYLRFCGYDDTVR